MMQFNQNPTWGGTTTCVISRTGDLLSKVWIEAQLPALNEPMTKDEFIAFKGQLLGAQHPRLTASGIPQHKGATNPYIDRWSYAINESEDNPYYDIATGSFHLGDSSVVITDATDAATANSNNQNIPITYRTWGGTGKKNTGSKQGETYGVPFTDVAGKFEQETGLLDTNTFSGSLDLQREFIQSNPGKYPKARYCDEVGHAMIEKVDLVIGGTLIDSHPGHYLQLWNELTQTPEKKQIGHLVGRSGSEAELEEMAMDTQNLYIPLQFFFCRHLMCSLPLIALQYHQVEIKVTFSSLDKVVAFPGYTLEGLNKPPADIVVPPAVQELGASATFYDLWRVSSNHPSAFVKLRSKDSLRTAGTYQIKKVQLMCNLVYLEEEERKTFAGSTHEYLVDLLQYQGPMACTGDTTTYHAYFNHPTSELLWTFVPKVSIEEGEPFNYTALQAAYNAAGDPLISAKLQFNGYDRFAAMGPEYFRELIPAQYHTSVPTRPVYCYSFALEPEDFRPSGSVNLSRIDNVKLITKHVSFNPPVTMQPFVGSDATVDFAKPLEDFTIRGSTTTSGIVATARHDTRQIALGTGGSDSSHIRKLYNQMNALSKTDAVAVHPTDAGNGLFLQQADGHASRIVPGAELRVYARSKNVLRIKSGMAGLAYAN
jgi:hypothetical protein